MHPLLPTLRCAMLALALCSMAATGPQGQPPAVREYSKSELETEQRIVRELIKDTEFNISRGIAAVGSNLAESAKVSVLRAAGRVAKIDGILKEQPEKIERLEMQLGFSGREVVRKKLRAEFDKLRAAFSAAEDSMHALRRDMMEKGLFGAELRDQLAVLDTVPKIIKDLEARDPAKAEAVRALLEEINQALAAGDMTKAAELMKRLGEMLQSAGYGSQIQSARDASGGTPAETGAPPKGPREISRRTLANGAEEVVTEEATTNPDGSRQVVRTVTVTNPDGSKEVTTIVENYDASGKLIGRTAETRRFDPSGRPVGGASSAAVQGQNLVLRDAGGRERVVPMSFFRGGTTATIYETRYIGGEGAVLTAEREIEIKLRLGPSGEFQGADQSPGRERTWDFSIEEVPGARTFTDDGSMQTRLTFRDNKMKTDFTIKAWVVKNPSGREIARFGGEAEVCPKLGEAGKHSLVVEGETDWGNPFAVSVDLDVAL